MRNLVILTCTLWVLATSLAPAQQKAPDVARWVQELDAEEFAVREQAERALIAAGPDVIPALREAFDKGSAELRLRARRIIARFENVEHERRLAEFVQFSKQADDALDLELGMCLISQIVDPKTTPAQIKKQLDELAAEVRKRLPPKIATADPREAMQAFKKVLCDDLGFRGAADENYQNPDNSAVSKVLASRRGLPILLSHVAVSVGQRLDLPIVGLGISGRYMCKYDGERAPPGFAKTDYVLNMFEGKLASRADFVREREEQGLETSPDELIASPTRATLSRMLRNLAHHAEHRDQPKQAELALQYILAIETPAKPAAEK